MTSFLLGRPGLLSGNSSNTTAAPTLPPPPSFADFKFTTIGRQPELLKRFSTPDPNSTYHYQHSPSPTPAPEPDSRHFLSDTPSASRPTTLSRPTLLQALASPTGVVEGNLRLNQTMSRATNVPPLSQQPNSQINRPNFTPMPSPPFSISSSVSAMHSSTTPLSLVPKSENHHLTPPPLSARDTPTLASFQLEYPPVESMGSQAVITPAPVLSQIHTPTLPFHSPTPEPELESPLTTLRALQTRLMSSVSALVHPTSSTATTTAEALLLAQSAHTRSATSLSAAHRALNLAQKSLTCAQDSLASAQECLATAEDAKVRAGEAMTAVESLRDDDQNYQRSEWPLKELKTDLDALGIWLGEREGEEAARRRENEKREAEEKDKAVLERAMSVDPEDEGSSGRNIVRAMSVELARRRAEKGGLELHEQRRFATIPEVDVEEMDSEVEGGISDRRSAEIEADVARRAWDRERSVAERDERRRAKLTAAAASAKAEAEALDVGREQQQAAETDLKRRVEEELAAAQKAEDERCARMVQEIAAAAQAQKDREAAQSRRLEEVKHLRQQELARQREEVAEFQRQQRRQQGQLIKERDAQREAKAEQQKAAEADKEERRDTALRQEQDKRRQQIMEEKQRANADAASRILAERARERQVSESATALTTIATGMTTTTPNITVNSSSKNSPPSPQMKAQTQTSPPATSHVGNVVARKTMIPISPTSKGPVTVKEKSRAISGGVKLGAEDRSKTPSPTSARKSLPAVGSTSSSLFTATTASALSVTPSSIPAITPSDSGPSASTSSRGLKISGFVPATTAAGRAVATDMPFSSITLASEKNKHTQFQASGHDTPGGVEQDKDIGITRDIFQSQSRAPPPNPATSHDNAGVSSAHDWDVLGERIQSSSAPSSTPVPRASQRLQSLPPIEHIFVGDTDAPQSPVVSPTISTHRRGQDRGNLPMVRMKTLKPLAPEAHLINVRHMMQANGVDWEEKIDTETIKVKPESDTESDELPLSLALRASKKAKNNASANPPASLKNKLPTFKKVKGTPATTTDPSTAPATRRTSLNIPRISPEPHGGDGGWAGPPSPLRIGSRKFTPEIYSQRNESDEDRWMGPIRTRTPPLRPPSLPASRPASPVNALFHDSSDVNSQRSYDHYSPPARSNSPLPPPSPPIAPQPSAVDDQDHHRRMLSRSPRSQSPVASGHYPQGRKRPRENSRIPDAGEPPAQRPRQHPAPRGGGPVRTRLPYDPDRHWRPTPPPPLHARLGLESRIQGSAADAHVDEEETYHNSYPDEYDYATDQYGNHADIPVFRQPLDRDEYAQQSIERTVERPQLLDRFTDSARQPPLVPTSYRGSSNNRRGMNAHSHRGSGRARGGGLNRGAPRGRLASRISSLSSNPGSNSLRDRLA